MIFTQLRSQHNALVYQDYHWKLENNQLKITFNFLLQPDIVFNPSITIKGVTQKQLDKIPENELNNLIFHLGMMEIPSYWKTACPAKIIIKAKSHYLLPEQISWWEDLLLNGLGEFFYTNKIDFTIDNFVAIINENSSSNINSDPSPNITRTSDQQQKNTNKKQYLIPVGGGKDSALTLGILEKHNKPFGCLLLGPHSPSAEKIVEISKATETIHVERTIDPTLIKLNQQGYLNGHTPFSAYLAMVSTLVARIFGYSQILLSNEHSANEGNALFHGKIVNHQYSKTFDFENKFRDYVAKFLIKSQSSHKKPEYLSVLRPLYELQIANLFSKHTKYHKIFRSCNVGQKKGVWCHKCSKCLFVFLMLYPFIDTEKLTTEIFQSNLFKDESLLPIAKELIGISQQKPFECVGTREESLAATYLSVQKILKKSQKNNENNEKDQAKLPILLELLWGEINNQGKENQNLLLQKTANKILNSWNPHHNLEKVSCKTREAALRYKNNPNDNLAQILQSEIISHELKQKFKKFNENSSDYKSILILGFGREGQSTYKFIRKYLPKIDLTIADSRNLGEFSQEISQKIKQDKNLILLLGDNYLQNLEFDIIFKTAGIPITAPSLKNIFDNQKNHNINIKKPELYSNTRLFFELCPGKIIGITGTKGKSTTASLIHHILKTSSFDTILVGNIGQAPLSKLSETSSETLVINELSSHQLAELKMSPDIAVVQNITSEHLDYYNSTENYVEAKSAICKYQTSQDFVIFNPSLEGANKTAQLSTGKKITFSIQKKPHQNEEKKKQQTINVFIENEQIFIEENNSKTNTPIINLKDIHLPGEHNLQNIIPSIIVAKLLKTSNKNIAKALQTFKGLPHRLEYIGNYNQISYYNDSLSTLPDSAIAAIQSFPNKEITLLAGGYERHQDFSKLAKVILQANVTNLILFPDTGKRLWQEIEKIFSKQNSDHNIKLKVSIPKVFFIKNMKDAITLAKENTNPSGIVLLSPASASFNIFKNYQDRGDQFTKEATTADTLNST